MEYQRRPLDDQWSGGGRLTYSDFAATCGTQMKGFKETPTMAAVRQDLQHPPWLQVLPVFKHAPYYVDSDDDSGIGHSNGGQGERISSTSSTETDGTPDSGYPPSLINNFRIRRSRESQSAVAAGPGSGGRQHAPLRVDIRPPPPGHPWSAPAGCGRLGALHGEFRPAAVSTPDSKGFTGGGGGGQVFDPAKFYSGRPLPSYEVAAAAAVAASIQRRPSVGRGSGHVVPVKLQQDVRHGHQPPHPAWRDLANTGNPAAGQIRSDCWTKVSLTKRTIPAPIANTPRTSSGHHRYHRSLSQPADVGPRRVRSFCGGAGGDSSLYSNVYENSGDGGDRTDSVTVESDPTWLSDSSRDTVVPAPIAPSGFAAFGTSQMQHYDKLPPTRPYLPPTLSALGGAGCSLQRAKSASLASLITVDSAMVQVRACPASVIPASEMGDVNSTMSGSLNDLLTISGSSHPHHHHLLHHQLRPLPPPPAPMQSWRSLPPPPLPARPPASVRSPPSPGHYRIPPPPRQRQLQATASQHYDTPPRRQQQQQVLAAVVPGDTVPLNLLGQGPSGDVSHTQQGREQESAPAASDDVAYAKVNKPRPRPNRITSNELTRLTCVDTSSPGEEVEPPLPPRNYKRNLLKSRKLSGSRGSLAEKMQDFTRTAKQVLRKAFSLEALNCKTDPALNDSLDWDNEEDWSRVVSGPTTLAAVQPRTPRTVAAVKARDAAKRDRQQQLGGRRQLSVSSSVSPSSSSFFSSANSSNRSSPVSQQTLC